MTDHPTTFGDRDTHSEGIEWHDRAALHAKDDGDGVFDGAKALRRGTFAEMVRHIVALSPEDREKYVIEKAGDRQYSAQEALALAEDPTFPKADGRQ